MVIRETYCSNKWSVSGLTESLASEVNPLFGIETVVIDPCAFHTEFLQYEVWREF